MPIDDRLGRLEDRMVRVETQLAETRVDVKEARADIHELVIGIQGPPREGTLRDRIHKLEDMNAAAKAAEAALAMAKAIQQREGDHRFGRREKIAGLLVAVAAIVSPWVFVLIYHSPPHAG